MAVTHAFGGKSGHHTSRMSREIQISLGSGVVKIQALRSLELTQKNGRLLHHLNSWYKLLPALPLLERLTLRGFRMVDANFPTLPQLKEAHFYDCSSSDSESTTKTLLEKLSSLRTFLNFNTFGKVSHDAFEPVKDTLETLAWVDTAHEYPTALIPNIGCLRKLQHLKTGFLKNQYEAGFRGVLFWNGNCLMEMKPLETVEMVVGEDEQCFLRADRKVRLQRVMSRILGTFGAMKMAGGVKGLRVVDMRCFKDWSDDVLLWQMLKVEFMAVTVRRFEKLGVTLLLPGMSIGL
ncbi:uncharacterized protein ColSpa_04796 [Colletotrichum spaethianum]|uniref:Uncharacterized protein n=1 Tax=Colletotrichum spaethianum TaxID=700344 RepID=A0AA37NZM7_9PEZI|nr:uncharacterized protein ColSpa_04796 [Colletotrichum spaethianum]GKT44615.1 hypothetical protein ColSpa_04796 [Colletotrichum spaethianum]